MGALQFQMGQTIEVLKSFVDSECGIPMDEQQLFLEDQPDPLMDPLTLLDFPQVSKDGTNEEANHGRLACMSALHHKPVMLMDSDLAPGFFLNFDACMERR